MKTCALFSLCIFLMASGIRAELRFADIFGENMVLQRDAPIAVWGWAEAGDEVAVSLGDRRLQTNADGQGRWEVKFPALAVSFEERELAATAGDEKKSLKGILIGEVWLCGGQSNMAPGGHNNADVEYRSADSPAVRYTFLESQSGS